MDVSDGITREENSNTAHIVNADQYDNETNVWANSTIRALVHENFDKFYRNIGLPNPRSDRRLKNVGKEFTSGLEKLKNLIYITILTKQIRIKHHM